MLAPMLPEPMMPMFTVPPSRAGAGRRQNRVPTPCKGEVNPEHAIRFKEARDNEAPRIDGLKPDVGGQLQHGWLVRIIVTADKDDGTLAVEGRIGHIVESGLIEGFEYLRAIRPLGHFLRS
jgi:hypothetical protein